VPSPEAEQGTVVTLEADGEHAGRAVDELAALLENDLDAEPDPS